MISITKKNLLAVFLLSLSQWVYSAPVIVDSQWLSEHINDDKLVIIDMSSDSTQYERYERYHLPNALHLSYKHLTRRDKSGVSLRVTDKTLYQILGFLGISNDSHVIIYDDMAGLDAGRLFWELERIGHKEVSVLHGGLVKWVLNNHKVTNKTIKVMHTQYHPNKNTRDNEATLVTVEQALKDQQSVLLDARSLREYTGDATHPRSGHIPQAHRWEWTDTVDFKEGFILKPADILLSELQQFGINQDTPVIAYCRSGHRASHTYLTLRSLGLTQVKLYDGSMSEWSQHKKLPIHKGTKP